MPTGNNSLQTGCINNAHMFQQRKLHRARKLHHANNYVDNTVAI